MPLVEEIHRGLYEAWLFVFETTDTPYSAVRPEYLATAFVAERLRRTILEENRNFRLVLEERVSQLATACFRLPPFPRLSRRIPARKTGKKGDREKVDICVYESGAGLVPVARHLIEIKISDAQGGLREDLLRNKRLMELSDLRTPNTLESAHLAFIISNDDAFDEGDAAAAETAIQLSLEAMIRSDFESPRYVALVNVQTAAQPPCEADRVGEFRHMISVVISFNRRADI